MFRNPALRYICNWGIGGYVGAVILFTHGSAGDIKILIGVTVTAMFIGFLAYSSKKDNDNMPKPAEIDAQSAENIDSGKYRDLTAEEQQAAAQTRVW